jgi:hypothetical protein
VPRGPAQAPALDTTRTPAPTRTDEFFGRRSVLATVTDLRVTTPVPTWARHTTAVRTELTRLGATRARIEIPPARDHREATLFAPHIQQMRG